MYIKTSTGELKVVGEEGVPALLCSLHSGEEATGPTPGEEEQSQSKYLGGGAQKFQQEL